MSKNTGVVRANELLLAAMARGATQAEAAAQAGLSTRTARRRLADPEFQRALSALRFEAIRTVGEELRTASVEAIATLRELLDDHKSTVRLGAARTILDQLLKYEHTVEIANRVSELENQLDIGNSGLRSA